jgi:hypothetical protein
MAAKVSVSYRSYRTQTRLEPYQLLIMSAIRKFAQNKNAPSLST